MLANYQPIVDLRTHKVVRAEAFCRFPQAPPGLDNPDDFIKFAEQNGLIKGLTEWLLTTTLQFWKSLGTTPLELALNVSVQNLTEVDFAERTLAALKKFKMEPSRVFLEFDERVLDLHDLVSHETMAKLTRGGIRLVVDGFGPSLSLVSHYEVEAIPLAELKIDERRVHDTEQNAEKRAQIKTIRDIARANSLDLTAKGVENDHLFEWLARFGFVRAQGYGIAPPMNAESFTAWLSEREASAA